MDQRRRLFWGTCSIYTTLAAFAVATFAWWVGRGSSGSVAITSLLTIGGCATLMAIVAIYASRVQQSTVTTSSSVATRLHP